MGDMEVRVDIVSLFKSSISNGTDAHYVKSASRITRVRRGKIRDWPGPDRKLWSEATLGGKIRDPLKFAEFIRRVGISLDELIPHASGPWSAWRPGDYVVVLLGERRLVVPDTTPEVQIDAVGSKDAEALACLILNLERVINCRLEVRTLPVGTPSDTIDQEIEALVDRTDVGAVITIGSPYVNPAADPLAQRMIRARTELPGLFCWYFSLSTDGPEPVLYCQDPVARQNEGILIPGTDKTLSRKRKGQFKDCGMLLVDVSKPTRLIVCAGHGGSGTLASVHALNQAEYLSDRIAEGDGRAFELIECRRKNPEDKRSNHWDFV